MIELIPGLPDYVLGIQANGEVTNDDYAHLLIPAIEQHLEKRSKIRLLYVVGDGFSGYSTAAMWDDAKVGLTHTFSWERVAVVTDHDGFRILVRGFGFLIPGEVRVFDVADFNAAEAWIIDPD